MSSLPCYLRPWQSLSLSAVRAMSGFVARQQQGSVPISVAHITTKGRSWSGLLSGTMLISKGYAELAPTLAGYGTWES